MERLCFLNNLQFPKDEDIYKMQNIFITEIKKRGFKKYLPPSYCRNGKKFKSEIVNVGTEFVASSIGFGEYAFSRLDGKFYETKNIKGKLISKRQSPQEELLHMKVNTYKQFHCPQFNIKNWEKIYNQDFYEFINKKAPELKAFYLNKDIRGYEEVCGRDHCGVQNFPINFIKTSNNDELLQIDRNKCLNCGLCEKHCPVGAIKKDKNRNVYIDQTVCNKCKDYFDFCACSLVCGNGAIKAKKSD